MHATATAVYPTEVLVLTKLVKAQRREQEVELRVDYMKWEEEGCTMINLSRIQEV